MSTKINQELTSRELEIERSINSSVYNKNYIWFKDVFQVEEYMCEMFYKSQKALDEIEQNIKNLREELRNPKSNSELVYDQLEIQTFRKEKLIQDTRKLFDKLHPVNFFQYLKEIYENTKTAAGTGTMSAFFEKLESESA